MKNIIIESSNITDNYIIVKDYIIILPHTYIKVSNNLTALRKNKYKKSIFLKILPNNNIDDFVYYYNKDFYKSINQKLIPLEYIKQKKVITFDEIIEIKDLGDRTTFSVNGQSYIKLDEEYIEVQQLLKEEEKEEVENINVTINTKELFITKSEKVLSLILSLSKINVNFNFNIVISSNLVLAILLMVPFGSMLIQEASKNTLDKEIKKLHIPLNKSVLKNIIKVEKEYEKNIKEKVSFLKNKKFIFKKTIDIQVDKKTIKIDGKEI